uniref:Protein PLANT CADMIUM RESISTANCE 2-like n=1 Tax=Saccoglossus kowalevskii TaxID=10224 RepID=A0ABM0MUI4_SACKO|nr:PREDICTED: protein PLANT CADMIUM RESISTANCE 2-like [Saccoglossus kowalevskii]
MSGKWNHGLCGCFNDLGLCIVTYFVPCYTAGKNAEAVGEGCLLHTLLYLVPIVHCICAAQIRGKIRHDRSIKGSNLNDMLMHCFCPYCSLTQEAQELKSVPSDAPMARF